MKNIFGITPTLGLEDELDNFGGLKYMRTKYLLVFTGTMW